MKLSIAIPFIFSSLLCAQAINPAVTQENIHTTICKPIKPGERGYSANIRPPVKYTNELKRKQMRALHLPGTPKDYEEDHIIALSSGGAPMDPRNLRPELWSDAKIKDQLEDKLHRDICAGRISLREAQKQLAEYGR